MKQYEEKSIFNELMAECVITHDARVAGEEELAKSRAALHEATEAKDNDAAEKAQTSVAAAEARLASLTRKAWVTFNVLTDRLEDENDPEREAAYRWLLENAKRPYSHVKSPNEAVWFNGGAVVADLGDVESDLPEGLYKRLKGGKEVASHRCYDTLREAYDAVAEAFVGYEPEPQPDVTADAAE